MKWVRNLVAILAIVWAGAASAALVNITSGTATAAPGDSIFAMGPWRLPPYFQLAWNISKDTETGVFQYHYDITTPSPIQGGPEGAVSHWIFGVSPSFDENDILVGSTEGWELGTFGNEGNSNPGIPDLLYGIKFPGSGQAVSSFDLFTRRGVDWCGSFYAKDGRAGGTDVYAFNVNFGQMCPDSTSGVPFGYIPTPDTIDGGGPGGTVPEPATFALAAFALAMVPFARRRRAST